MNRMLFIALALAGVAARADEGMWTYDNFPAQRVAKRYGFAPDERWLEEARLSSVRLAGGCSGSFVSPDGLVMTNHHCAHRCIEHLSTRDEDLVERGFSAATLEGELRCPEIEINQLLQIADVTARVQGATRGLAPGKEFNARRRAVRAAIEKECARDDEGVRCDVVELYHGGQYSLYRYKRFQDVRLVFAPEFATAFFGGDPDNFTFPRYDLDVTFLRAYAGGEPARTDHWFRWSPAGPKEGELTFVSGHPGRTDRELTMAQLQYQRDFTLPEKLFELAEFRGALATFAKSSPEHRRISKAELFGVENSYKAIRGRYEALIAPSLWNGKAERERQLRRKIDSDPQLRQRYGGAWDEIGRALALFQPRRKEWNALELAAGFNSRLFKHARTLVRGTEEIGKPNGERLKEYADAKLPAVRQALFSKASIYQELEIFKLSHSLAKLRETLGPDHPFVKKVLGKRTPEEVAAELGETKLYDPALRRQLWNAGKAAVRASDDVMIRFARMVDEDALPLRRWHDEEVDSLETHGAESVALAKFELEGKGAYPDATFSLRLSYGSVEGYRENGKRVQPFTVFAGAFDRDTRKEPFRLPDSWTRAHENKRIDPGMPLDFCTTNDIIGGNSGSPVFNRDLQIVGLIFDGNIQSLGGEFFYEPQVNRAVALHSSGILHALDRIYGAHRLVQELKAASGGPAAAGVQSLSGSPPKVDASAKGAARP